ncbi:MAG: aminodeoxychorismate/anthranilate synthase component II [Actinomycetota bacterium]|nr:aminodeoxychorismate/anthranilate synthase component II [Actinomycetota bacterium]
MTSGAARRVRVLVVDHYDSYTWNLVHLVAEVSGTLPDVVEHDQVDGIDGYTHVVLSPGPGHPDDQRFFSVGRGILLDARVSVLGVCLGMQGLVTAYGGRVERVAPAHGEIAIVSHDQAELFEGMPDRFRAVRYHSLAAVALPACLKQTALDEVSGVTMGVAHRERPLFGVQFHPESILSEHGAKLVGNFLGTA